jgi:hypothetical protein
VLSLPASLTRHQPLYRGEWGSGEERRVPAGLASPPSTLGEGVPGRQEGWCCGVAGNIDHPAFCRSALLHPSP